jgi:hypothetical protein
VALVALPLAGLSLLATDGADQPPPVDHAAAIQPLAPPASPAAVRPPGATTDAARVAAAARALGLVALLLAVAGVGRRPPGVERPTGRGPPLLPR